MNRRRDGAGAGPVHGLGLIEILIALVVLSIGSLAAARMQVEGMRSSQSAYYNTQAYYMASDMIDRMRANVEGVNDGEYDGRFVTGPGLADPGCAGRACTPAQLAAQDLFDWSVRLHPSLASIDATPSLPSGDGITARAEVTGTGDGQYTIDVRWAETVRGRLAEQSLSLGFVSEDRQ